jgi:hypothetical protein
MPDSGRSPRPDCVKPFRRVEGARLEQPASGLAAMFQWPLGTRRDRCAGTYVFDGAGRRVADALGSALDRMADGAEARTSTRPAKAGDVDH